MKLIIAQLKGQGHPSLKYVMCLNSFILAGLFYTLNTFLHIIMMNKISIITVKM